MLTGFDKNEIVELRPTPNHTLFDEPIGMQTVMRKYYYLFDGLGSVTGLTDSGGNLVATYSYDAFGNILSETGDATLNAINPYRFTSRVYDKESGLYYYRARYYDSSVGRFISKDPLRSELTEGKNLYVYVGNNPVVMVDPTGTALAYCTYLAWKYYDEACVEAAKYLKDKKITYDDKFAHAYIGCKVGRSWWCWSNDIRAIALLKELAGYIGEKLGMPQGTGWSWDDYHATMWGYYHRNDGYWTGPWYWRHYVKYSPGKICDSCPYLR